MAFGFSPFALSKREENIKERGKTKKEKKREG